MWTAGMSSGSDRADYIALSHALSAAYIDGAQVAVQRLEVITMIDHDHVAVAIIIPAGINNDSSICRVYGFTLIAGNINAPVVCVRCIVESRQVVLIGWPNKRAESNCTAADRITRTW